MSGSSLLIVALLLAPCVFAQEFYLCDLGCSNCSMSNSFQVDTTCEGDLTNSSFAGVPFFSAFVRETVGHTGFYRWLGFNSTDCELGDTFVGAAPDPVGFPFGCPAGSCCGADFKLFGKQFGGFRSVMGATTAPTTPAPTDAPTSQPTVTPGQPTKSPTTKAPTTPAPTLAPTTAQPTFAPTANPRGLAPGAIAGIIIGVIAILSILVGTVVYFKRRRTSYKAV